jgi:hypothetical protein
MVRWAIEATVTEKVDPLNLFPDVRLGDPVRGMLKYDVGLFANPLFSSPPHDMYYTNETWVDVARMVIENPRNGSEYAFQTDVYGDLADVLVSHDIPDDEFGDYDSVYAFQSVNSPAGYLGEAPAVGVILRGPTTILPPVNDIPFLNIQPPAQLDLNAWPIAAIVFWDAYFADETATQVVAEIYSLTPALDPHIPGDYDYDGDVDHDDYFGWKTTYGEFGDWYQHYADGNGDDSVDAADYTVWRNHLGTTANAGISAVSDVPEPHTMLIAALALGSVSNRRRLPAKASARR